jgi:HlyD family secretion protein
LPRDFSSRKESLRLRRIETAGQEENLHRDLEIKRLEVAKQERDLAKSRERLAHLRQDLETLVMKAPRDGIVYYGAVQRGKWVTAQAEEKKLVPGGSLTPGKVVMSPVDPDELQVRLTIPEARMKGLEKGQKAVMTLKWNDDLEMDSTIEEVIHVPQPDSTFTAVGSLDAGKAEGTIFPGMTATVEVTTYRKRDAIVVPKSAIKEDGDKSYVTMKDGKRRWIELGQSSDKKQEILKGLKEGEKVAKGEEKKDEPETK